MSDQTKQTIEQELGFLSGLHQQMESAFGSEAFSAMIEKVLVTAGVPLTDDQAATIQNGVAEYFNRLSELESQAHETERIIKAAMLDNAITETIRGGDMMTYRVAGRETWDGKALNGYAAAHPEILPFKKTGSPSVTIKSIS